MLHIRIKGREGGIEEFSEETELYKDKNYQQSTRVRIVVGSSRCLSDSTV